MAIERADFPGKVRIEKRSDGKSQIVGYGAVFYRSGEPGTEYELWSNVVERVAPTAFATALSRPDDVRALFNHDPNFVLGRSSSGTMTLSVDDRGLRYVIDPPDTQQARDLIASIERGDISGSSFSFSVNSETWTDPVNGGPEVRTINDVTLYDVGPVTFPAYEATAAGMRGKAIGEHREARQSYDKWRHKEYRAAIMARHARSIALDSAK